MDPSKISGLTLMHDLSASDWVVESLMPWAEDGVSVASILPAVFEAYARVVHPVHSGADPPRPWTHFARVEIGPETSFREATGLDPTGAATPSFELPHETFLELRDLLGTYTARPDRCWFCIWVGYGFWHQGATAQLTAVKRRFGFRRAKVPRPPQPTADVTTSIPRVRIPHREYFFFRGRLSEPAFRFEPWFQPPNIWWPDDRAWCVATELDGYSTYVGGTRACIDAILASPGIEALEVGPDVRLDPGPFR
jgi:hypothetical protein